MDTAEASFEALLEQIRPKLHRYCARLVGSVIDGEDVVQEALAKAFKAWPRNGTIENPESWFFRIAHNVALDVLRRRARQERVMTDVDPDSMVDRSDPLDAREIAATSLRTFMRLPLVQRSAVLLVDVLEYSLAEASGVMETSLAALKSALHRGRASLRDLAREGEDVPVPALAEPKRSLLNAYVERFNARDFDAIRNMISDEIRLEVVSTALLNGRKEASTYFTNYTARSGWHMQPGLVEGRPAALVHDERDPAGTISYFVLLDWKDGEIVGIRDFFHARYVVDGAECAALATI